MTEKERDALREDLRRYRLMHAELTRSEVWWARWSIAWANAGIASDDLDRVQFCHAMTAKCAQGANAAHEHRAEVLIQIKELERELVP